MISVHTSNNPAREAAQALTSLLKKHMKNDVLLLFSGGSSLAIVDHLHPKHVAQKTTISVLDERYSTDPTKGNFTKIENSNFAKACHENGTPFIDPRPLHAQESLQDCAKRFDLALKEWHITHQEGVVIATVGVGSDVHVAGILPMSKNPEDFEGYFLKKEKCAVGYNIPPEISPHTERITVTLSYFLRHVHHAVIYATGAPKKDALNLMIHAKPEYAKMPATVLQNIEHAELFTDLRL